MFYCDVAEFVKAPIGRVRKVHEIGLKWAKDRQLPLGDKLFIPVHDALHKVAEQTLGRNKGRLRVFTNKAAQVSNKTAKLHPSKLRLLQREGINAMSQINPKVYKLDEQNNAIEAYVTGLEGVKAPDFTSRDYWKGRRYRKKVKNNKLLNDIKSVQAYRSTELDNYMNDINKIYEKNPSRRLDTIKYKIKRMRKQRKK